MKIKRWNGRVRKSHFIMACGIVIAVIVIMLIVMTGCQQKDDTSKATDEVGDIIFDGDTVTITAVDTDEYLEVYQTEEIEFAYFADSDIPVVMKLGGATLSVIPGDKFYDQLECAVLTVFENDETYDITDVLAEFFVCHMADGEFRIYYEVYNEYAEEEDGKILKKYVNLKAYRIDFKATVPGDIEFI